MLSCPCSSDKTKEEKPLEGLVKDAIAGFGKKGRIGAEEVVEAWVYAVGKAASKHSKPVSFNKSVLLVNIDDSGWLYELTIKKKEVLKKLIEKLKGKKLNGIRFRIGELK